MTIIRVKKLQAVNCYDIDPGQGIRDVPFLEFFVNLSYAEEDKHSIWVNWKLLDVPDSKFHEVILIIKVSGEPFLPVLQVHIRHYVCNASANLLLFNILCFKIVHPIGISQLKKHCTKVLVEGTVDYVSFKVC